MLELLTFQLLAGRFYIYATNITLAYYKCLVQKLEFWVLKESENQDNQLETHSIHVKVMTVAERLA